MTCQMQSWHLLPYSPVTDPGGEGLTHTWGHRKQLHQPCQNTSSLTWRQLRYVMGAAWERCQAHFSQETRHLTPQTCRFTLSFPTPSRGDGAWWTFPPQISGECPNARLWWQFLSWPFLQPKEYVMASHRRASRERSEIAPSQDTIQPYVPFNSYLTTWNHLICRCLY